MRTVQKYALGFAVADCSYCSLVGIGFGAVHCSLPTPNYNSRTGSLIAVAGLFLTSNINLT